MDTSHEDEEEVHVMHTKEEDIEDSDNDFDPIGFGIEECYNRFNLFSSSNQVL